MKLMAATIRLATAQDAGQIQAIYAPYVRDTAISFEYEPPSVEEMRRRVVNVLQRTPWSVCENAGTVFGYAYASEHRVRAAYKWSVDVAVYIDGQFHGFGIG